MSVFRVSVRCVVREFGGEWLGTLEGGCGEPFSWDSVFQNLVCTASYDASVVSC